MVRLSVEGVGCACQRRPTLYTSRSLSSLPRSSFSLISLFSLSLSHTHTLEGLGGACKRKATRPSRVKRGCPACVRNWLCTCRHQFGFFLVS